VPSLIVDTCYYTQLALASLLQLNRHPLSSVHVLQDIHTLRSTCDSVKPTMIFLNADGCIADTRLCRILKCTMTAHPGTRFFVLTSYDKLNALHYVPVCHNVMLVSKGIPTATLYHLIARVLRLPRPVLAGGTPDITPFCLSRAEFRLLSLWMAGCDTQNISQRLKIKKRTVHAYKQAIRRKVRTQNKQAIHHVVRLVTLLTPGMLVGAADRNLRLREH